MSVPLKAADPGPSCDKESAFEADDSDSSLTSLDEDNAAPPPIQYPPKVPRPKGQVGKPNSGGFSLDKELAEWPTAVRMKFFVSLLDSIDAALTEYFLGGHPKTR